MKPTAYYLRTSSAQNLGGDSESRQLAAIQSYAKAQGLDLVQGAYDQAVSGTDFIQSRAGLTALLDYCQQHQIDTILVENATRFARSVTVQELGYQHLKTLGVTIVPVDAPDYFINSDDDPTKTAIRQMLGVMSQLEKEMLVKKLKSGREKKRLTSTAINLQNKPKVEGRKAMHERFPELPAKARKIKEKDPSLGLRKIAAALHKMGYHNTNDPSRPLSYETIKSLLHVAYLQNNPPSSTTSKNP